MKSTTTINLAQRLITIDTDAQVVLANYLEALKKHFSAEQSGDEIYADIENRIAEIMAAQQKNGSSSITVLDVQDIISRVGTLDELGIDGAANTNQDENSSQANPSNGYQQTTHTGPKRLRLNVQDKIISGLCSGIAQYLNIDAVWVRLTTVLLAPTGISIVAYIILSLVLPKNFDAVYANKRIMRDIDSRLIAGVCSGIAYYFNTTPWIIRLVFLVAQVLSATKLYDQFHLKIEGLPILAYIILWLILPKAMSPSQKLKMRGIDVNAKNIKDQIQGNPLYNTKTVYSGCAGFFVIAFKGFAWFIIGCILFVFAAFFGSAFVGAGSISLFSDYIFADGYQKFMATASWILVLGVPAATIIYVIIKALVGGRKSAMPWVKIAAVLWLVGLVCAGFLFQSLKKDFSTTSASDKLTNTINTSGDTLFVKADAYPGNNFEFKTGKFMAESSPLDSVLIPSVRLNTNQSADNNFNYDFQTNAYGHNLQNAIANATKVTYVPKIIGDTLFLPAGLRLNGGGTYRGQAADFNINIPNNKKIVFDEKCTRIGSLTMHKHRLGFNFNNSFTGKINDLEPETIYQMQNGKLVKVGQTAAYNSISNIIESDEVDAARDDIKDALNEAKEEVRNAKDEIKQAIDEAKLEIDSDDPVQAQKDLDSLQSKLDALGKELSTSQKEIFEKAKQKLKEAEAKQKTK
jgi:phage shock protein PspC (stress-responsive transcriptional regulator)